MIAILLLGLINTVQLLQEHCWKELDLESLIEEVKDLGNCHSTLPANTSRLVLSV